MTDRPKNIDGVRERLFSFVEGTSDEVDKDDLHELIVAHELAVADLTYKTKELEGAYRLNEFGERELRAVREGEAELRRELRSANRARDKAERRAGAVAAEALLSQAQTRARLEHAAFRALADLGEAALELLDNDGGPGSSGWDALDHGAARRKLKTLAEGTRDLKGGDLETTADPLARAVKRLLDGGRVWTDGRAVVDAEVLVELAELVSANLEREDSTPTVQVASPQNAGLPEAMRVERATFNGWLGAQWATVWCRRDSRAAPASPVPWDPEEVFPWVVEVHLRTPERDGHERDGSTAFAVPCPVDPGEPSPEADAAIALAVARAMIHEGQESLMLDGERSLDPHERGELGLAGVAEVLGAWLPAAQPTAQLEDEASQ